MMMLSMGGAVSCRTLLLFIVVKYCPFFKVTQPTQPTQPTQLHTQPHSLSSTAQRNQASITMANLVNKIKVRGFVVHA